MADKGMNARYAPPAPGIPKEIAIQGLANSIDEGAPAIVNLRGHAYVVDAIGESQVILRDPMGGKMVSQTIEEFLWNFDGEAILTNILPK